ncbi:hypothetical protein E7744_04845 [Citricoccus sp. SGAir0253]|uniref:hypothetical protein n=1 Tax=Citricoccus sp. SGAir0253 TaxID=2567881 RepID=UPI0010CCF879|nr:hypothetical protein [Citricoccus sp. SGAir0253]QCU77614.1 hypothetical protein E7744_04845 [Citricoccus sp. SGAir0253]
MTRTAQSTPRGVRPRSMPASGFRVKWDRTLIALVALLAVLVLVVTGVAALFGAGTGGTALVAALVAAGGVASLRALALRDRKARRDQRIERAFTEAMNPGLPVVHDAVPSGSGSTAVFDAASGQAPAPHARDEQGAAAPAAAPAVPAGSAPTPAPGADLDAAALPSVPRPTYLDAAEAHRPVPEPLVRPEVPAAQPGTKLKSGVSGEYLAKVQATANRSLDLDKVLQRRRAV